MDRVPISPRLPSLEGKVVYCIAQDKPVFTEELARQLRKYAPGVKVVFKRKPGWIRTDDPELRDEIEQKADAMIYGTAMGGGSGLFAVGWIKEIEKRGVPSVYVVGGPFLPDVRVSAEMRGMPALRTVVVPLVGEERVTEDITDKQYSEIVSRIVEALTRPLTEEEKKAGRIFTEKPSRMAMTGTLDEVQDYFYEQRWSDGLPIVPPTEEKVQEMLKGTSHSADEVVTETMFPEELTVTVEKVAIVGVMAGCQPNYMPVLLAIVEAWGKGPIFIQAARSDSTFSFMIVVNGPVRNEIKMNPGTNAMGPGNQANAAIGRFLRLAIINLGGSWPGINDMSSQGSPTRYSFCFPEYEEESPWEPLHVSMGYKREESVVSVLAGGWCHWSFIGDIDLLAKAVAGFYWHRQSVVILAPRAARLYAAKGMSKEDVEDYIWEHAATQLTDQKASWFRYEIPTMPSPDASAPSEDVLLKDFPRGSVKVVVAGGDTSLPVAQAWQFNPPTTVSIDKWR
jgi:hypothetical protein